jgi:hypothetical protein
MLRPWRSYSANYFKAVSALRVKCHMPIEVPVQEDDQPA